MSIDSGHSGGPPVIVWTLQRSGGTNFVNRLARLTTTKKFEHEPFNKQRVFGHVTREWMEAAPGPGRDAALSAAIDEVLKSGVNIKHCVEMMPIEISEVLAEASAQARYGHLILYRRAIVDRLMSLYFARQTGIWGPGSAQKADQETLEKPLPPIPVDELIDHEKKCLQNLNTVVAQLKRFGATYFVLAFEDIYDTENPEAAHAVLAASLDSLGIQLDRASFLKWVESVQSSGEQGTRSRYAMAPGYERLVEGVKGIVEFRPSGAGP